MARILTVDDSATMRQMVSYTLSSAGHEVQEAASADEAIGIAQTQTFDLVIADVNMPGKTGIELVALLRAMPAFQFTPILMLTTESNAELKQAGKVAGATGWIVKPFNPETLLSLLQRVLG